MRRRLPLVFSEKSLRSIWRNSRDARGARAGGPGIDRIKAEQFSSHLSQHIGRIRADLQDGTYQFSPLRPHLLPKGNGFRVLAIPTVRDRLVQRATLTHLYADKKFSVATPISFGFRPCFGIEKAHNEALKLRSERPWVLKVDIIQFFDRIDRSILHSKVEKVRSPAIRSLLHSAINCEIDSRYLEQLEIAEANGIKAGEGLRQGMPLSPLLSNLMLKGFDIALGKHGYAAVRYADDIAVFCSTSEECYQALEFMKNQLKQLKLSIPEIDDDKKTEIVQPSAPAEFLGLEICRSETGYALSAPNKKIVAIGAKMAEVATVEYCSKKQRTISQISSTLDAMISGHRGTAARVQHGDQFLARLAHAKKGALNQLLVEVLGQKTLESLSNEKKAILGFADF